jgi:hypothetical protein
MVVDDLLSSELLVAVEIVSCTIIDFVVFVDCIPVLFVVDTVVAGVSRDDTWRISV